MKKFLVLSFLMVMFAGVVSFAQTRTVNHYKSNPSASVYINYYDIAQPSPSDPFFHLGTFSVSAWSPGDIEFTNAYIYVKFKDGHDFERYRTVYDGDGAFADYHFDPSQVEYVVWSFELICTNGDAEIYDITDVYN